MYKKDGLPMEAVFFIQYRETDYFCSFIEELR